MTLEWQGIIFGFLISLYETLIASLSLWPWEVIVRVIQQGSLVHQYYQIGMASLKGK
jgi:hypothetical protein